MKVTTYICDICGKNAKRLTQVNYPVVFYTEQNEGKPTDPYISQEKLELCSECVDKVTRITACGAMGYNKYRIKE